MLEGRVAPAAVVVGEGEVGGAEVGGRDGDGSGQAPFGVVGAGHFVASAAAEAVVEQRRAQRHRVRPVPLAVQVPIPTSSAYIYSHQQLINTHPIPSISLKLFYFRDFFFLLFFFHELCFEYFSIWSLLLCCDVYIFFFLVEVKCG